MSGGCSDYTDNLDAWPNCSVPDCSNKSCLSLYSLKCWPHTVGQPVNWADGLSEAQIGKKRRAAEKKWREAQ
jgi:hypothetical protein